MSATSVYGDHKGKWVNEESITKPSSANGTARLASEKSWLSLGIEKNLPIQVFRLSGIYSNKSNTLTRLKNGNVNLQQLPIRRMNPKISSIITPTIPREDNHFGIFVFLDKTVTFFWK